ncbi:MAG: ABC transporter ATP-binding protein [Bdellovibrionota bacterium]
MVNMLLSVDNLTTNFSTDRGEVTAVDSVSFSIAKGQTVGLVGESGSGKSVTSLSIMRLIQSPPGKIVNGSVHFEGQDLVRCSEKQMRTLRGNSISMIFQEPMTSLNPVFTIGNQISEVFRIHQGLSKKEALQESIRMLDLVKIPAAKKRIHEYPHQLSGGMRQRIMIAIALACKPKLLIADEPTTALDVTIQAQILDLMAELQEELGMAILMITHDLGVVAEVCDYVLVMYAGRIVEQAPVKDIFTNPQHPYTIGLLNSIPKLGKKVELLPTIAGTVPSLAELGSGCHFYGRCSEALNKCEQNNPPMLEYGKSHCAACWNRQPEIL